MLWWTVLVILAACVISFGLGFQIASLRSDKARREIIERVAAAEREVRQFKRSLVQRV
jgi:hypothetical protein